MAKCPKCSTNLDGGGLFSSLPAKVVSEIGLEAINRFLKTNVDNGCTKCLRKEILDTKSIIELLVEKEKKQYLDNVELNKEFLWDKFFNITQKIKDYKFDNTIITDGYATSLRFIHNDYIEGEKIKKEKMKKGRKDAREMTTEDKEKKKIAKKKLQDEKKELNKLKEKPKNVEKTHEFPYIDDVDKEELKGNHIFIDPGKRSLFTMMNDDGKFYSYTNKQ